MLAQLIRYLEWNRSRIRERKPWHRGLAVGSGAVAGVCMDVMQRQFVTVHVSEAKTTCSDMPRVVVS